MSNVNSWLLEGDVSIQYQTWRDLLGEERPDLQRRIEREGWGAQFLAKRQPGGYWGRGFYQTKWVSSHYTLLDLRNLCLAPGHPQALESIEQILEREKSGDGGVNPARTIDASDVCVNGMVLNYASYFGAGEQGLRSIVDFLLGQAMPDGGFNCRSNQGGARHSSLHSTISVLEGIFEYRKNGYTYRLDELLEVERSSREFIFIHRLFKSDRTGKVIRPEFTRLHFPSRWHYDILRALDYFRYARAPWDERMRDALDLLSGKRDREGRWKLAAHYPGQLHFEMEKAGTPSRWATLMGGRVMGAYEMEW